MYVEGPISNFISMLNDLQINPKTLIQKLILYPPWLLRPPQVNTQLINYSKNSHSPPVIKQNYLELLSEYKKFNLCFTDGSKIPTLHSGYAYSINDKISNFKIHNCSSIYTAELTAIFHCLCDIFTYESENKSFLIQSDSLSSLTAIQNLFSDHPLIQNIHKIPI